ncbi:MAG TPA: BadF/BadG/BcrA/BcrD ATPase family protein [Terracidiphilus sp.]|jgi:N-acetylglucosamine kinase-like BadF-type ATPase|nr:BadF/BadG/BcrA/BcrD ATPase family protein [Terracidiphilus sp.]
MSYFLVVDSGGTKAAFLLAEGERELARATCGTIKRVNADESVAAANLVAALAELERATGISMSQVTRTCIGTSGNTVPLVTDWLQASFAKHVGGELLIVGDVDIALDAVFRGGRGVLVLSGTGSNVAARVAGGAIITAGGWGPMLADQGAGHWIGMEGLRRGFLARDEQRPTRLLEAARALWNLPTEDALIEFANAQPAARYGAEFARAVVQCAEQGDAVALEILERGGRDLAYLATLLIERMRAAETGEFLIPDVAIAGSILIHVALVRNAMQAALRERYPGIRFIEEPADPVRGALWRALRGT